MSRIGKKTIPVAKGVTIKVDANQVAVTGAKGTLEIPLHRGIQVTVEDDAVTVARDSEERIVRAMHGTTRALIANMIVGVTDGYIKELDVVGVGWNAAVKGKEVHLNVGYADTRKVEIPAGITVEVNVARIRVSGVDKQLVGQVAAEIRRHRKPEPYNGKGIRYVGEQILRKEGKAFGK